MANWIMSITGVAALGVLLDILLPKGQTDKYIKGIFSLIVIYVIISPLPALLSSTYDADAFFKEDYANNYEVDDSFLSAITASSIGAEERAEKLLKAEGYHGVKVRIVYEEGRLGRISYVNVDFSLAGINKPLSSIEINDVKRTVANTIGVEREEVRIIGSG